MRPLRQSTAATVIIGPFLDDTDGKTAETALTINRADVHISKNAGTFAQKDNVTACTHRGKGHYSCPLASTDLSDLGHLRLAVQVVGALAIYEDFQVLPADVYDSMYLGTDNLTVDLTASTLSEIQVGDALADSILAAATADPISANLVEISTSALNIFRLALTAHSGLARNGGTTTIQLAETASGVAGSYVGQVIMIISGAGSPQAAVIQSYNEVTKTATVNSWPLGVNPNNTSFYSIMVG